MVATTTPSIKHKFKKIINDFSYNFKLADTFYWSSTETTIYHKAIKQNQDLALLLHEIAHAELKHTDYTFDVELIKIETEAWDLAKNVLSKKYEVVIGSELMQDNLNTYRTWLHKRSLCPDCAVNGIQTNQNAYSCINCRRTWRVNNSLFCELRRFRTPARNQI